MRRGTTPTYLIQFNEGIGAQLADICLTFRQGQTILALHLSENQLALNGDLASCTLTQAQTNAFRAGVLQRQVKIKFTDNTVQTSDIANEGVYEVLHVEEL